LPDGIATANHDKALIHPTVDQYQFISIVRKSLYDTGELFFPEESFRLSSMAASRTVSGI
jgi:hypothetical protein